MELKKLFTEDRAVSPVIAVVLMIAVTVILAAVVAAFALGLGGGSNATPQASFDFEPADNDGDGAIDNVTATMESGDVIRSPDNVTVTGSNISDITEPVQTGDSATVKASSGTTVRVEWESGESDKTATLAKYEVNN